MPGRTLAGAQRLAGHAFTLAFVAAWAAYAARAPVYLMPGPLEVARGLAAFLGDPALLRHMAISLFHVAASIAIAFALGSALALLAHYRPLFRLAVHGRISPFLNSFSGIGWTLLAIVWFGITDTTVIFAISAVLTPFAIVNMRAGLEALDPEMLEMGRSFTRAALRQFRLVVLPALYPFMFATLRISFGVAWKVALTAELFGGNAGFGYLFNQARQNFDTPLIFVVIVLIIAFVFLVDRYVFAPLQRRLLEQYADA